MSTRNLLQTTLAAALAMALAACGSSPTNVTNDPHTHRNPHAAGNVDHHGGEDHAAAPTPAAPAPPAEQDDELWLYVQNDLYKTCALPNLEEPTFRYDSSRVKGSDMPELALIATCLTEGPLSEANVELLGRADPRGAEPYNEELGLRRAQAVKRFLTGRGVADSRIVTKSAGEEAVANDPANWREARRVDIALF